LKSCLTLFLCVAASTASAQSGEACRLICAPQLLVEPTITFDNLARRPRVAAETGEQGRVGRETVFEIIVAVDVPTRVPRLGFTAEAIWTPFARTSSNPFTGRSASDLGSSSITDNPVELEFEVNFDVIESEQTGGWLASHFDVVDQFSPAERPTDRATYTHKLNLELDTSVAVFNWLPEGHWLRSIEIEGSLDYVATGLPKAGDDVNGERFLDDASPWSLSVVFVIPLAPFPK
jgi:hypothetical protein